MLSVKDIREVKFGNSVGGYKKDEVDDFLDHVLEDYREYDRAVSAATEKIDSLKAEIESLKASEDSIQNVLLSAQRLADSIVAEAKEKSAHIIRDAEQSITKITEKERELATAFEQKATARREEVERELEKKTADAERKLAAIERATADSVARQQMLFNRLKIEIAAFKMEVNKTYKEHLESLQKLPEEVPSDPKAIAAAVEDAFNRAPAPESFVDLVKEVPAAPVENPEEALNALINEAEENEIPDIIDIVSATPASEETPELSKAAEAPKKSTVGGGFIITSDDE